MSIRPKTLKDFTGQISVRKQLQIAIKSAKSRGCVLPHVLMGGPPGLGKTTIAEIIAEEMNGMFYSTMASIISKPSDLFNLFSKIEEDIINAIEEDEEDEKVNNIIIFIDEVEQLKRKVSEMLHTALEDGKMAIKTSDGSVKRMDLPEFTLIAATNYKGELPRPFLDRFKINVDFEVYSEDEIIKILKGVVKKMKLRATVEGVIEIARRSRGVPRIAIRYLEAARDVYLAYKDEFNAVTSKCVFEMFKVQNIDELGLSKLDKKILGFLNENNTAVGLTALAQGVNEDISTVELSEGYMIRLGLINRGLRGREITEKGKLHLGINV